MLSYSDSFMRSALVTLIICVCSWGIAFSQSPHPSPSPSSKTDYENRVVDPNTTSADIARLPMAGFRPPLTLQRALKIAKHFTRQQRIDLSPYYLLEIRMIEYGDGEKKEPRWFFRWVTPRPSTGGVEITVSMKGQATRLISW